VKKSPKHIAISGNIGSGKTTLTEKLARHYGWFPLYESVDNNPYLRDFYSDMARWAFHLQIYFLNSRFKQINAIRASEKTIIQDRTIYEDAYILPPTFTAAATSATVITRATWISSTR
jgi:deoxyadenosine/deoxycytidine kinase